MRQLRKPELSLCGPAEHPQPSLPASKAKSWGCSELRVFRSRYSLNLCRDTANLRAGFAGAPGAWLEINFLAIMAKQQKPLLPQKNSQKG